MVHIFPNRHPVLAPFVVYTIFPQSDYLGTLVKKQLTLGFLVSFWSLLCFINLYVYLYTPIPPCLNYCSFTIYLNTKLCNSFSLFFFKIVFGSFMSFAFPKFQNHLVDFYSNFNFSISKNSSGIFTGISLHLQVNLGENQHLKNNEFLILEYSISHY